MGLYFLVLSTSSFFALMFRISDLEVMTSCNFTSVENADLCNLYSYLNHSCKYMNE